jgi:hypothetical protein
MGSTWHRSIVCTTLLAVLLTTGTIRRKAWAQVAATLPATQPATAPAVDTRLVFDDAIALTNPLIRLEVSPSVGRIIHFGPTGGANLFWINTERGVEKGPTRGELTYRNYGGDKIWPTLQAIWPRAYGGQGQWPPDGIIDGQAWTLIDRSERRLVMQSPQAAHLGIQVKREIELHETEPRVTIRNTITRQKANIFPVHVWTISQVRWPNYVLMDVAHDRTMDQTWIPMGGKNVETLVQPIGDDAAIRFDIEPKRGGGNKVGTLGRWLAAVWDDHIWYQWTDFDPAGMYPDASSVQIYYDGNYTELELLSPMLHLKPGESLSNTVTWQLTPRAGLTDQQITQQAEQLSAGVAPSTQQK